MRMKRVLIVEDDKLVRKGLILAMPWSEYDMEVVGEARNGQEALEFLESNEVDFLWTDLSMPVMSGIELMKIVREKYPEIYFVVLTFHQDFEYIQEALRLGAIDFISKVELERDNFSIVLARILDLITQKERVKSMANKKKSTIFTEDCGYVLLAKDEKTNLVWVEKLVGSSLHSFEEIGDLIWFGIPEKEIVTSLTEVIKSQSELTMLKIEGLRNKDRNEIFQKLRRYRKESFFYDYDENCTYTIKTYQDLHFTPEKEVSLSCIKKQWLSFDWVYDKTLFSVLKKDLKELHLPHTKLFLLINEIGNMWNRVNKTLDPTMVIKVPETLVSWKDTESWLFHVVETANQLAIKTRYSEEVLNSIMSAVKILQDELDKPLFAIDVATRVNMSRSYFNQCFKEILGRSFNEYLRYLRIERAKDYLLKTDYSVQWIAEQTGYRDEKYFCRVFRQITNKTPSSFRRTKS